MISREIYAILDNAKGLLASKAHDYADDKDPHSNFKYSSTLAEVFPEVYKPYAVLIGVKLSRIAELLKKKEVKHESLEDSFVDLINYCALMAERYVNENNLHVIPNRVPSMGFADSIANASRMQSI